MAQYTIEQMRSGEVGRTPGQIGGQQFIVRDCQGARIYLLDAVNTITVDDCTDCLLVAGAVRGRSAAAPPAGQRGCVRRRCVFLRD